MHRLDFSGALNCTWHLTHVLVKIRIRPPPFGLSLFGRSGEKQNSPKRDCIVKGFCDCIGAGLKEIEPSTAPIVHIATVGADSSKVPACLKRGYNASTRGCLCYVLSSIVSHGPFSHEHRLIRYFLGLDMICAPDGYHADAPCASLFRHSQLLFCLCRPRLV